MPKLVISEVDLERYWKTVVSTIQDGIMIVDTEGTIISVNRALEEMTRYSREELIGQKCSILNCNIFPIVRERGGQHWCELLRTGTLALRRCTIMKKDGAIVHILKNASGLHDSSGRLIGAVETITDITEIVDKEKQIAAFQRRMHSGASFHGLIGASRAMQEVFRLIENAAGSDAPVLIMGESGTGKELVARAIHELGARGKGPLVCVNCAALTESLLESELFGHVRGAYTGAYKSRAGRFEIARGGDIFLDEIGDLSLSIQVKLLRVLEEKVIERVGDTKAVPVDVRIISATNRNLLGLLEKGAFRKDFYFRINVIPINLPPLRARTDDIPVLADHFRQSLCNKTGKDIEVIDKSTMEVLVKHPWPGNVRELKSVFEYLFATCQESIILPDHLPPDILRGRGVVPRVKQAKPSGQEIKKRQLIEALARTKGNKSRAAEILGISRVTVWNRMKHYGLADPDGSEHSPE